MDVKSAVLRMIFNNSKIIGAIIGCATVVYRNMIVILVVIVATISLSSQDVISVLLLSSSSSLGA